ncbi:TPA: hypothetical protein QDB15_006002 [Burkholderia vietnamiensis]|uniref:hypothetical protein n=1 Tax=Burkholderia vietnamiensis TaxID=60552 RepID=UPI0015942F7E|nr:hypothetical protein [Burkholderia vietnamiensis]MCA8207137.1 hypothetical protein [Burkholderia vietnamiensis]HDR9101145.1 hypothetical protein [Burkholderia vietnamiensis]HDR9122131.1 hypothetical protein [Burkholderia vietnamiensis]HDR9167963.1 hypothetical protein [Burkholderia vietnamiensis]HDR9281527.1 hypothetical protein [Burkholderia vietnamiensis]
MIPRNLKHVGPYADRVNNRAAAIGRHSEPLPDDCKGALIDPESGAPFLPWGPRLDPSQLEAMQRELFEVVDALAKLEGWPDDHYDHVVLCIERQPISTLRPDLAYFREQLRVARTEERARQAASQRAWRFDR